MQQNELTSIELLILGLVAEMPRHGYELEQVIDQRKMREWTQIGFSSIYYALSRLEQRGLIKAGIPLRSKAKKKYEITTNGRDILTEQTQWILERVNPTYPSLLLGLMHWPVLSKDQAIQALTTRQSALLQEVEKIDNRRFQLQPLPDYMDAVFEYSIEQLKCEYVWVEHLLAYMSTKPWNI